MALPVSFEFFPPKTPEGAEKLRAVRQQLYGQKPEFCSVTYGAGGSTQQGTFDTVGAILAEGVAAASHFSCIGATQASVREQLVTLKAMGVKRLVALRGDLPSGYGIGGEFHYASDLVAFIRAETGRDFHIEVAAYPEVHPQAKSPESDLQAFVTKVRAGADSAITQYFYNSDAYFRFVDEAQRLGADVPVFVHGFAALARGVGEQLTPSSPPEDHYLLLYPGVAIATAAIFTDPALPRATPPLASDHYDVWQLANDCEAIAMQRYPEVEKARSWLLNFAPTRMTGTGSCLFARFDCARAAQDCAAQLPAGWQAWVCRGQNRSPLHQALAAH